MEMRHFFEMPPLSLAQTKLFVNKNWYKSYVKKTRMMTMVISWQMFAI